jgi:hypothetical protein
LIRSSKKAVIVEARVPNMAKYIPVAVATEASTPIITNIGQKIMLGDTPQKAAIKAPEYADAIIFRDFTGEA